MALIESRWITLVQESALSLGGETWARRLPFGRNWQRIRFGILANLQAGYVSGLNALSTNTDIKLMIGLASSDSWTHGVMNASCGVGVNLTGSAILGTNSTASQGGNYPLFLWTTGAPHAFTFRSEPGDARGQTRLSTAMGTSIAIYPDGLTDGMKRRGLYVVDITRPQGGSGQFTVALYAPYISATTFSPTAADLMDVVATLNTSITINSFTLQSNSATVQVAETAPLDTMFVYNSDTGQPLMIYAIAALVFNDQPYDSSAPSGSAWSANEAPVSGTETPLVASTDLVGGDGWSDSSWSYYGTGNPILFTSGLAGTAAGPLEVFQLYNTTPTDYGSYVGSTVLAYGTGWSDIGTIYGTSAFAPQNGFAGTTMGWPWEIMQLYNTGSVASSILTYGTGWSDTGVMYGTGADTPQSGYAGTTMSWPYDSFEQYNTGTVFSGLTISYGTGWSGAATIN